ncbi:MAG: hypothetical protein ABIP48_16450 [Planctomycetota bacterium]
MMALETDLLAELVRGKLDCLGRLRDMGTKQLELVRADRIAELLDLLAAKHRVLVELQKIEKGLAPFRGQAPERRTWRTPEARRECARHLDACEAVLGEIVAQEKQSELELTRRRDRLSAQLQGVHLASQARGAYTAQSPRGVTSVDLISES